VRMNAADDLSAVAPGTGVLPALFICGRILEIQVVRRVPQVVDGVVLAVAVDVVDADLALGTVDTVEMDDHLVDIVHLPYQGFVQQGRIPWEIVVACVFVEVSWIYQDLAVVLVRAAYHPLGGHFV